MGPELIEECRRELQKVASEMKSFNEGHKAIQTEMAHLKAEVASLKEGHRRMVDILEEVEERDKKLENEVKQLQGDVKGLYESIESHKKAMSEKLHKLENDHFEALEAYFNMVKGQNDKRNE